MDEDDLIEPFNIDTVDGTFSSKGLIIGAGGFGVVCIGVDSKNKRVAIKIIKPDLPIEAAELSKNEVIMKGLSHNNILKLLAIGEHPKLKTNCLVLDFCTEGSLADIMQKKRLSEDEAAFYFIQIASGLKYLHDNNIIHRDLKPDNLLLTKENNKIVLKIADFGIARPLDPNELAQTMVGTNTYMAPEIFYGGYTNKVDIWSCGVILVRMLTGCFISPMKQIIVDETVELRQFSDACRLLLSKMIQIYPENRISTDELVSDPFLDEKKKIRVLPQMREFYFNQKEEPELGTGKLYSWNTIRRTKNFGIQEWGVIINHDQRVVVFVNNSNVIRIAKGTNEQTEKLLNILKIVEERENFEISLLLNILQTKNLQDAWEEYLKKV